MERPGTADDAANAGGGSSVVAEHDANDYDGADDDGEDDDDDNDALLF